MSNFDINALTVDDLKKDEPVFCINTANGDVIINIYSEGRIKPVVLPKTYIPIRATDYTRAVNLKNSDDFRRLVATGVVKLITKKEAIELMKNPAAQREAERLRGDAANASTDGIEIQGVPTPEEIAAEVNDVTVQVLDILNRDTQPTTGAAFTDADRVVALETEYYSNRLTKRDIEYIISVTKPRSETNKWAVEIQKNVHNDPRIQTA